MTNYIIIKLILLSFLLITSSFGLQAQYNGMENIWQETTPSPRPQRNVFGHRKQNISNRRPVYAKKAAPKVSQYPNKTLTASTNKDIQEQIKSLYLFIKDYIENLKLNTREQIDHIDILYRAQDKQFLEVLKNSPLWDEYSQYLQLVPTSDNEILARGLRFAIEIFTKPKSSKKPKFDPWKAKL